MTRIFLAVLSLGLVACAPQVEGTPNAPTASSASMDARVVAVSDGDTIVLDDIAVGELHHPTGGRKARLIGIDTPELFEHSECYGQQARDFTMRRLNGTAVQVTFDVERTDRYGRALVYVWDADGRLFNAELLEHGLAQQLTIPPNVRYADLFSAAAGRARRAGRGLWSACD